MKINKAKKNNRMLNYSMIFFVFSILVAVMGSSKSAYGEEASKVKGPIVENCVTLPDSVIYAFATDCTGTGLVCVDTECPEWPPPTPN